MKNVVPHTASDFCVEVKTKTKVSVRKFTPLSKEEFDAKMDESMNKLEAALERGRQDRLAAEKGCRIPSMNPGLRFR